MGFNIGGLAAAYEGYKRRDQELEDRAGREEDRAYLRTQREYQGMQQQRQKDQWSREDERAAGDAAAPTTRQVTTDYMASAPVKMDEEGNQMPAATRTDTYAIPKEEQIRAMADRAKAARNMEDWAKLTTEADKLEAKRMSTQALDIISGAKGKTAGQIAREAEALWSASTLPVKVGNVRENQDGSVTMDVTDRDAGTVRTKTFRDAADVLENVRAMGDPSGYAALQQERLKAQMKILEERAKGHVVSAGGMFIPGEGDTRKPVVNANGFIQTGTNDDGTPILVRAGAGGATATGTGSGKGPAATKAGSEVADKIIDGALKGDENLARAHNIKAQVRQLNPKLSEEQVADIAIDAVRNPNAVKPVFNPDLGAFQDTYNNPKVANTTITLGTRPTMEDAIARLGGEKQVRAAIKEGFGKLPDGARRDLASFAKDPKKAQALEQRILADEGLSDAQKSAVVQKLRNQVAAYRFAGGDEDPGLIKTIWESVFGGKGAQPGGGDAAAPAPVVGGMRPPPGTVAAGAYARGQQQRFAESELSRQDQERMFREGAPGVQRRTALMQELGQLTPDLIKTMPAEEAMTVLRKYREVLTPQQQQQLSARIYAPRT